MPLEQPPQLPYGPPVIVSGPDGVLRSRLSFRLIKTIPSDSRSARAFTAKAAESHLVCYLVPRFGPTKLESINQEQIQAFVSDAAHMSCTRQGRQVRQVRQGGDRQGRDYLTHSDESDRLMVWLNGCK